MAEESIGPLITTAAFCEKMLQEKDGTPSLIRMVDRITLERQPITVVTTDGAPVEPAIQLGLFLRVTSFRLGTTHELTINIKNPSGKETEIVRHKIELDLAKTGINFRVEITLGIKEAGWHWARVYLDGQLSIQIPLEVVLTELSESR